MRILAIESSCDETACAVVDNGRHVISSVIASQVDEHRLYGGVVPEIASRRHVEAISPLCQQALDEASCTIDEVDAIAVTATPGLIGALLVGVNFAKGLAYATKKPLIPVHHIKGHIAANYIAHPDLQPPFLCLVVSGGHSHIVDVLSYTSFRVLGRTRDDAAGEAYDKAARVLGFPYPGGVHIDQAAVRGFERNHLYPLPTPKVNGSPYDFSFSGLKTAVINLLHHADQKGEEIDRDAVAASFQHTAVNMLKTNTMAVAKNHGYKTIALAGGVSANAGLRQAFTEACKNSDITLYYPPLSLCGDNAAMIGAQAFYEYQNNNLASLNLNARASCSLEV